MRNGGVELSVNHFGSECFSCATSFNTFADTSCSTPRRVGGVLNRDTCFFRNVGDLNAVGPVRVGLADSSGIVRNSFLFNTVSGSLSINNVIGCSGAPINLGSNVFRIVLVHGPSGVIGLRPLISNVVGRRFSHRNVRFFHAGGLLIRSSRRIS